MKIFVAGATGIIGRNLIPLLRAAGHTILGTTRTAEKGLLLQQMGATPVVADVFEREQLIKLVREAEPDLIIHQLTDLSVRDLAANARIRIEGTRNLVDAAHAAGVKHMLAQSISWAYAPGEGPADEDVPLDIDAPQPRRATVEGIQALENAVAEIEQAVILRYGLLYGPGTWYAPGGMVAEQVRRGEVKADDGVTSFLHIADAAQATVQALAWPRGIVNIVDDEPASGRVWLPIYAKRLNAPAPPIVVGQPRAARGATNTKARQLLHWQPRYPSWREGFPDEIR